MGVLRPHRSRFHRGVATVDLSIVQCYFLPLGGGLQLLNWGPGAGIQRLNPVRERLDYGRFLPLTGAAGAALLASDGANRIAHSVCAISSDAATPSTSASLSKTTIFGL